MSSSRYRLVLALLTVAAVATVARAFQIMVLEHEKYVKKATAQQQTLLSIPSLRGTIRTADGYTVAQSIRRTQVTVDTAALRAPKAFATVAATTLGQPEQEILDILGRQNRFVTLAQRAELDAAEQLRALVPNAIILLPASERLYPLGELAAAVVGFVGEDKQRVVGRWGLEAAWEDHLSGEPDLYRTIRDAVQRNLAPERVGTGRPGRSIELTIHARVQAACEAELSASMAEHDAASGSAVVLDPYTGEIIALASLPSFDPAAPAASPRENWDLRPVVDALEPGSTVKPMIAAIALAHGAVNLRERFDCTRHGIMTAGQWIADHATPGVYTLPESIAESSNAALIEIAQRLEPKVLLDGLRAFGFGRPTGCGFPGETHGMLPKLHELSALSRASIAIGQELTVSPLQLATAYAVFANGGLLLTPHLVRDETHTPPRPHRVLPADLAAQISQMLRVVVETGTGSRAAVPGYSAAGKTGTAQRAINGSYAEQEHISWFVGFAPADRPVAVVAVALRNPTKDFWGASVAAPCFARIAASTMALLNVPPNATDGVRLAISSLQLDDLEGAS